MKNFPVPKIDLSIAAVSIKPADPNSSIVGKSVNFCILKWFKKLSVVAYCIGLPGTSFLPAGLTQFNSKRISIVLDANVTPLISSISDLVTGWW